MVTTRLLRLSAAALETRRHREKNESPRLGVSNDRREVGGKNAPRTTQRKALDPLAPEDGHLSVTAPKPAMRGTSALRQSYEPYDFIRSENATAVSGVQSQSGMANIQGITPAFRLT